MGRNDFRWAAKRAYLEFLRLLPDRFAIGLDYMRVFGVWPNLANPRRFSEKMQHLKLEGRDPRMPELVDKVRVKDFVARMLGEQWLIPTLWHGPRVSERVLRGVSKPAVVKANHSSAQTLFLHANSDFNEAARKANSWLNYDHHVVHREWAYGEVQREILIEPFIGEQVAPDDYKFWVFDGEVRLVQLDQGRFKRHTRQFYTPGWRRLDLRLNYPDTPANAPAPSHLAEMLHAAQVLAEGFRFVRVDMYDTPKGPLFGEMTFAPEAGLCRFHPRDFDAKLGESWAYPRSATEDERLKSLSDAFRFADPSQ
jgi:hypothetical protein